MGGNRDKKGARSLNPDKAGIKQVIKRDARGRFLPGKSANPAGQSKGTKHDLTRIKNVFIDAFEAGNKGKEIIEEFRDSLSKRDKKIFIDWLVTFANRGNGHNGGITINIVNQIAIDLVEAVKKHVKDPVTRNRIAGEFKRLGV